MESAKARAAVQERKQETRHKIQLGRLVIRAGIGAEDTHVLYGGLLELSRALEDPRERERLQALGRGAFPS